MFASFHCHRGVVLVRLEVRAHVDGVNVRVGNEGLGGVVESTAKASGHGLSLIHI